PLPRNRLRNARRESRKRHAAHARFLRARMERGLSFPREESARGGDPEHLAGASTDVQKLDRPLARLRALAPRIARTLKNRLIHDDQTRRRANSPLGHVLVAVDLEMARKDNPPWQSIIPLSLRHRSPRGCHVWIQAARSATSISAFVFARGSMPASGYCPSIPAMR